MDKRRPHGRRVLVVEDDALVSETIAAMLEGHYEPVIAETAQEAMLHLQPDSEDVPDTILLDCLLPGGGLANLLQISDQRAIQVVLISGDPDRAARIGAGRKFLPKPFNQATLLGVLGSCDG